MIFTHLSIKKSQQYAGSFFVHKMWQTKRQLILIGNSYPNERAGIKNLAAYQKLLLIIKNIKLIIDNDYQ